VIKGIVSMIWGGVGLYVMRGLIGRGMGFIWVEEEEWV
jgi:hypothetical protein